MCTAIQAMEHSSPPQATRSVVILATASRWKLKPAGKEKGSNRRKKDCPLLLLATLSLACTASDDSQSPTCSKIPGNVHGLTANHLGHSPRPFTLIPAAGDSPLPPFVTHCYLHSHALLSFFTVAKDISTYCGMKDRHSKSSVTSLHHSLQTNRHCHHTRTTF